MKTIILANGEQDRWSDELPKQLIKILGERLIDRIKRYFPEAETITHNKILLKEAKDCVKVGKTPSTVHTLAKVITLMPTLILLGDVFYSESLIGKIKQAKETTVFGNGSEIFAIYLKPNGKALEAIDIVLDEVKNGISKGKLWDFYKYYSGGKRKEQGKCFVYVDDESQDFDRVDDIWLFYDNLLT